MSRTQTVTLLTLLATASRVLPHPPNCTAATAVMLFGLATLPRWLGFLIPIAALLLSDTILSILTTHTELPGWMAQTTGFYSGSWGVYCSLILAGSLGLLLRNNKRPVPILLVTLGAATIFFLVSNYLVWQFGAAYHKTPTGLVTCYTLALPFFHWTLIGDLFYSTVLFGTLFLVENAKKQTTPHPIQHGYTN